MVWLAFFVMVGLVAVCVLAGRQPGTLRRAGRTALRASEAIGRMYVPLTQATAQPPSFDDAADQAGAVEAELVTRRLSGELPAEEYRRAMAELAAADVLRQPMAIPSTDD
jgi:hypothetical protein